MKLSALFARYLYQQKRLNLPGIGVFSIDPSITIPDAADKNYNDFVQQIKYEQKPVISPDEELINFIRTETGKIKPLAESDLDSFLSDGKILLNIGKPFHIEGIGSLMKTKSGQFEFTPGGPTLPRLEGFYNEAHRDDSAKKKSAHIDDYSKKFNNRRMLVAAALVIGMVLIIWGGYSLYNRKTVAGTESVQTESAASRDTGKANIILDSVQKIIGSSKTELQQTAAAATPGTYKFIIERTASKERALKRYRQLTDGRTGIKMQTHDSALFNLYFNIAATPADTARIRDSLKSWYARRQVFVEQ
ncbi:MAG: hypothetical protein H0X41_02835 [Chitinophagaceae bacterium]|nr:hypothetical protein [Chitinophagaceae bacterium]